VESAEEEICPHDVEVHLPILPSDWLFRDQLLGEWSLQRRSSVPMMLKCIYLSCPETGCSETSYWESGVCRGGFLSP